jgi:hypothetical protein
MANSTTANSTTAENTGADSTQVASVAGPILKAVFEVIKKIVASKPAQEAMKYIATELAKLGVDFIKNNYGKIVDFLKNTLNYTVDQIKAIFTDVYKQLGMSASEATALASQQVDSSTQVASGNDSQSNLVTATLTRLNLSDLNSTNVEAVAKKMKEAGLTETQVQEALTAYNSANGNSLNAEQIASAAKVDNTKQVATAGASNQRQA